MMIVHHLNNSRSQRVLWLLEELGLDYEIKRYEREKDMSAPASLRQVHPLGKSPVLEEDAVIYVESGAIMTHLVDRHGRFGPPADPAGARRWHQYMHYAEGSLMPPLFGKLIVMKLGFLGMPARKPVQSRLDDHFRYLNDELSARAWFCGDDLTAADMMMSFPLEAAQARAGLDGRYSNILAWLKRCHDRPAYARALERGGEYDYA